MNSLLEQLRADLKLAANEHSKETVHSFFKEDIKVYGVKTPTVNKIAKKYWRQAKMLSKKKIFELCEDLYGSGYMEEAFIVATWLPDYIERLEASDIQTFKFWIDCYVSNWAECDSFCNHTIGTLILKYPEIVVEVKKWAKSNNRWLKRASAVSFILPARKGMFLSDAFEICDLLLLSDDDLVQKGYGWLLKEESRLHPQEVFDYVFKNHKIMPRTALRYAIELMPKDLRAEAMKKK
jgi:3-methyladenine DNA glycosylase AlkD